MEKKMDGLHRSFSMGRSSLSSTVSSSIVHRSEDYGPSKSAAVAVVTMNAK